MKKVPADWKEEGLKEKKEFVGHYHVSGGLVERASARTGERNQKYGIEKNAKARKIKHGETDGIERKKPHFTSRQRSSNWMQSGSRSLGFHY